MISFDEYFKFIKGKDFGRVDIVKNERLVPFCQERKVEEYPINTPDYIEELELKGLENLVGKNLVMGSNTMRLSNKSGTYQNTNDIRFACQVFDSSEQLKNNHGYPLVARIDTTAKDQVGNILQIEYGEASLNFL